MTLRIEKLRSTERIEAVRVESLDFKHLLEIARYLECSLTLDFSEGNAAPRIHVDCLQGESCVARVGDLLMKRENGRGGVHPWHVWPPEAWEIEE